MGLSNAWRHPRPWLIAFALCGCGVAPGAVRATLDGGAPRDGGPAPDAALEADGGHVDDAGARDAGDTDAGAADAGVVDAGALAGDGGAACPPGLVCVTSLPFHDERDTTFATERALSRYSCAPNTNEGGPEFIYRVAIRETGILGVRVRDGAFVDIDVHLLTALREDACVGRNDEALSRVVEPGTYYVVADTWVDGMGAVHLGAYTLDITFTPLREIACDMRTESLPRVQGDVLTMPATGAVVLEAHLVTTAERTDGGWPSAASDGLAAHYALSEAQTGYVMRRDQVWAPFGEGGSQWGQGSTVKPPPLAEGWYVNMYWRNRPPAGRRMIIRQPQGRLAVVAAAGYETGPGSPTAIGGATEEIHDFLGTRHRDTLTMGFAVDDTLPYGPVLCAP